MPELPEGSDTKRCAACRVVKPTSEYYKDRTHSRGIKTRCKQCLRACKEAFKNQQRAKSASEQARACSSARHIILVPLTKFLPVCCSHSLSHRPLQKAANTCYSNRYCVRTGWVSSYPCLPPGVNSVPAVMPGDCNVEEVQPLQPGETRLRVLPQLLPADGPPLLVQGVQLQEQEAGQGRGPLEELRLQDQGSLPYLLKHV